MTQEEKAIEIPFGAKDSELIKWEYTIPEGMEAEIKDGKVIIKKADSEDERIRRTLVEYFGPKVQLDFVRGIPIQKIRAWLEKQKESLHVPESCQENGNNLPRFYGD